MNRIVPEGMREFRLGGAPMPAAAWLKNHGGHEVNTWEVTSAEGAVIKHALCSSCWVLAIERVLPTEPAPEPVADTTTVTKGKTK